MGTRCDFYAGRGLQAEYLGSIGHDAFVDEMAARFAGASDRSTFEACLQRVFQRYGEIPASKGWPWPWATSATTDTVIAFDEGRCWIAHPTGCWAPLDDFDNPTDAPCVYADMLEETRRTPQGRVHQRLRFGTDMRVGLPGAVMADVLVYAGSLLSSIFLHGAERDGRFYVLSAFWESRPCGFELRKLSESLNSVRPDVELLLGECREVMPEEPWDLLVWLLTQRGDLGNRTVHVMVDAEVPVHFGGRPPLAEQGRPMPYVEFSGAAFWELYALWRKLVDRAPIAYAQPMADALQANGLIPAPRSRAAEWLNGPREEFGGKPLLKACSTQAGRDAVRAWAAARMFED